MFWWLWNYLRGYVIIRISGFSVERFINLLTLNGFAVWDIKSFGRERIMKAGFKDFDEFCDIANRCGCKIEVLEKHGIPFIINKAGKKRIFSLGIAAFAFIIFAFTRFIWIVDVEGNKTVSKEEILEFCRENGVYPGSLRNSTDLKQLGKDIILNFDAVGWAAVNTKGTKVTVSISEKLPEMEIEKEGEFASDIVATKDGIIESIMTEKGTAVVNIGDVVEKGDILIKGEVILKDGETETGRRYEEAKGSVMAKTPVSFDTEVEKKRVETTLTGETSKFYKLSIGEMEITLFKPDENKKYSQTITYSKSPSVGDFEIPIKIECMNASFYVENEIELTSEEAIKEAQRLIEEKKEELLNNDSVIVDEKNDIYDLEDRVKIKTSLMLIENIGVEVTNNNIRGDLIENGTQ